MHWILCWINFILVLLKRAACAHIWKNECVAECILHRLSPTRFAAEKWNHEKATLFFWRISRAGQPQSQADINTCKMSAIVFDSLFINFTDKMYLSQFRFGLLNRNSIAASTRDVGKKGCKSCAGMDGVNLYYFQYLIYLNDLNAANATNFIVSVWFVENYSLSAAIMFDSALAAT